MSDSTGSWQPDPHGRHQYRYWDGTQWTDQVANDGVTSVDPPDPGAPPPAGVAPAAETPAPADPTPTEPTPPVEPTPPAEPSAWGAPPTDPGATTTMPAAGGAPPGGGVPPTGTPPPSEPPKKNGANTPALIIGGVLLLVLLGAGAYLIFGSGDDDGARDDLVASLVSDGMSESQAECMVDTMADEIGMDRLQELDENDDPTTEEAALAVTAGLECGLEEAADELDEGDTDEGDTDEGDLGDEITGSDALMELFIQEVMAGSDLTEEQARCFSEEFLSSDIDLNEMMEDPEALATQPEIMSTIFDIFSTCDIDLTALGGGTGDPFGSGDTYGDDPELDALWDACEDGDGQACDDLFFQSPVGSEYEEFGDTCGGRFPAGTVFCADEDLG